MNLGRASESSRLQVCFCAFCYEFEGLCGDNKAAVYGPALSRPITVGTASQQSVSDSETSLRQGAEVAENVENVASSLHVIEIALKCLMLRRTRVCVLLTRVATYN